MSVPKIILSICLLHLFVGGIFAQSNMSVLVVNAATDSTIGNANISMYCNGKMYSFVTGENGQVLIPNTMQTCVASIGASGFETIYNVRLSDVIINKFKLSKKNSLLHEVVITGQIKNVLAENSIYKVQIINAKKIQQQAVQNLAGVLKFETGLNQQQDNILGSALNIQGIGSQNVKILVNGIAVNGRENGNIDLSTIPIANAERIEYIKGPMSVMYGTDALGGVINIITKQAKKMFSTNIYLESINKINSNLQFGFSKRRHAISINVNRNFFGGWHSLDTFNRNLLWRPKLQYMTDLNYTYATSKGKIIYTPSFMQEQIINKGTPFVDPFEAYASDEYFKTKRFSQSLQTELNLDTNNKVNVLANVSLYKRVKNKYAINMMDLNKTLTSNIGDQDTSSFVDYTIRATYNNESKKRYNVLIGFETTSQNARSLKLLNQVHNITDIATFASLPIKLNKAVTIQPAFRLSHNSQFQSPVLPSINIKINANNKNTIRMSAARGYRAPTLKEMYLNFVDVNHNIIGNNNLKAESGLHLQTNLDSKIITNSKMKLLFNTNVYFNTIRNQISLAAIDIASNKYMYANRSNFKNLSFEWNCNWQLAKYNASVGFNANHIFTADSSKGISTFDLTTQQNIILNKKHTTLNIFYKFIYKQPILSVSNFGSDALYTSYLPNLHQADANISQGFFKNKCVVQLGVKNIFNLQNVVIQGTTNSAIHSSGNSQTVSPSRSGFVALRYGL
jgi:outer membrane receptor for ferrienterochelin and colicins